MDSMDQILISEKFTYLISLSFNYTAPSETST